MPLLLLCTQFQFALQKLLRLQLWAQISLMMLQGASALQILQVRKALLILPGSECTLAVYAMGWSHILAHPLTMLCHADFSRPADKISYPQQCAVTATGLIWTRFSTVITPVRLIFSPTGHYSYLVMRLATKSLPMHC